MPGRYAEGMERQATAAIANLMRCRVTSLGADVSRPASWEAVRACVGQKDIVATKRAAAAAFCDNEEVQATPEVLL